MSTWPALADPRAGFNCHAQPHGEHGEARITFTYWIFFSHFWEGEGQQMCGSFYPFPYMSIIYFLFCSVSIIIIEGDWTTSWPEEEDQEDDISEGLNQFFYTDIYMSV